MGITPAQIAISAEAINAYPDLSPTGRRVMQLLLGCADRNTGLAWPSEARMAETLSVNVRSIRRAKVELHAHGLLTWVRRGTSKKGRTPLYTLAWDKLLSIAATIKAKVKAAASAARSKLGRPSTPQPSKPHYDAPRTVVGRTFASGYLPQFLNLSTGKGFWKAPNTPPGQFLTDQQLVTKAHARVMDALRALGVAAVSQYYAHPDVAQLEVEAVTAERFTPDHGRTGLAIIVTRLNHRMTS